MGNRQYKHIEGVSVIAQFAEENGLHYRYRLEVNLQTRKISGKTACVVMQNPSYAGEDVADKSVQFMEKVVFQKEFPEFRDVRRLIVVNQFARIQTNYFQGLSLDIGVNNNSVIKDALQESDIIIIAWGSGNGFDERKAFVFGLLHEMNNKQLLQTKMHPSRGQYRGFLQYLTLPQISE